MEKLKIAVIGAGRMGTKHIGNLSAYCKDDVEISGILCSTPQSTMEKAKSLNLPYFNSIDEINKANTDGVIIAASTNKHTYTAKQILRKGIPCLIEKPLTANLAEAKELIKIAAENNTFILPGHIEHYNPTYLALKRAISLPFRNIKAYRVGNTQGRKHDTSVVLDLMIHDIGIIQELMPKASPALSANMMKKNHWEDDAKVRLTYSTPCYAEIVASRVSPVKDRRMLIKDNNYDFWEIDFLNGIIYKNDIKVHEHKDSVTSLQNELRNFINCIRGTEKPLVTVKQAFNALKTALELERCCREEEVKQKHSHRSLIDSL